VYDSVWECVGLSVCEGDGVSTCVNVCTRV
jgi:hypothetical protein